MRNVNKNTTSSKRNLAFNKAVLKSANKYILKLAENLLKFVFKNYGK